MTDKHENGWSEYEKLVMYRLDAIDGNITKLAEEQGRQHDSLVRLRTLSSVWGAVGGSITMLVGVVVGFFHTRKLP